MSVLQNEFTKKIGNWLCSGYTGVSSETMAAIALGAEEGDFDAPSDPSDFGRCYRLVRDVPEVREFFPRISELVPQFAGILAEWDALEGLYLDGNSRKLMERIRLLRGDA